MKPGDLVTTLDHGVQKILWVRQAPQSLDAVRADDKPILISEGALGPDRRSQDLVVSPQHRILVGNGQLSNLFTKEAFVHAKALTELPGIRSELFDRPSDAGQRSSSKGFRQDSLYG